MVLTGARWEIVGGPGPVPLTFDLKVRCRVLEDREGAAVVGRGGVKGALSSVDGALPGLGRRRPASDS